MLLKNSLLRITYTRQTLVRPYSLQRKSFPISYYNTIHSRKLSIIGIIRTIIAPLSSFLSQSPQKATQELESQALSTYEKIKLPITHTFNKTPGFLGREKEIHVINDLLSRDPKFLIVNGSESVGKTALLREILSNNRYHVIYIDTRVSGFADVRSFTTEFATHLESFFNQIVSYYPNLKVFRDVSIAFKSLRLSGPESFEIRQDVQLNADFVASQTRNDLAKLLEKLRIGLLMYHEADLNEKMEKKEKKEEEENIDKIEHRIFDHDDARRKKIPIIVFDEAHKLRYLLNDKEALQMLFDALMVFTIQDRLCHVIHITSDSFYEKLLAKNNILHHTKSLIIGDLYQSEISKYFHGTLVPSIPQEIRGRILRMENDLHGILGGKILHWKSFVQDYIISRGKLTIESFEPFIRAKHQLTLLSKNLPPDDELIPIDPIINICHYFIKMNKVPYYHLCKEFTQAVIDALIEKRILEYRLIDEIGDVCDKPEGRPFVIPSSCLMKHAMKSFVKKGNDDKNNITNKES
ncbi:Archaeal ATPase-domain-containing protein [Rhizophagus diaphanus]|nr:Archaeal ATPase-domain-containing protein [Rhizophagus diaphanus] [Rhizophagus sp. MUCL 43196]